MNIEEALREIRDYIQEIVDLRKLTPKNQEYEVWRHKVRTFLAAVFGRDSDEYKGFPTYGMALKYAYFGGPGEVEHDYQEGLTWCETALKEILVKHETLKKHGLQEAVRTAAVQPPRVFIAHGGETKALTKLKEFLWALGVEPLVVEEQASRAKSVDDKVEHYMGQADCAIILATAHDKINGKLYPRQNVVHETGLAQKTFGEHVIYLKEEGAEFSSNISPKVWEPFTEQCMDRSFIAVARELKAFGMIQATRPSQKATNA